MDWFVGAERQQHKLLHGEFENEQVERTKFQNMQCQSKTCAGVSSF
jgi:hypothetical protein